MNFLSLCSGIEAASVAFAPLGWKAIAFSDIDPFSCQLLKTHYPTTPNLGDMTAYETWPDWVFLQADLVVGGPPCQAFSIAGNRQGLADDRGNLTLTYARLIEHADTIRLEAGLPPVIAIYENVPGILNDKTNAFGCLVGALSTGEPVLPPKSGKWGRSGYVLGHNRATAWRTLDAQYFGLAQRRQRVFVVSSARADYCPATSLFERCGDGGVTAPSRSSQDTVAGTLTKCSYAGGPSGKPSEAAHGLFQVECYTRLRSDNYADDDIASTILKRDYKQFTDLVCTHGTQDSYSQTELAYALGRNQGQENVITPPPDYKVRRLTPEECEKLMGFPVGYTRIARMGKPASDCAEGPRYGALGNSWAVPVARWVGSRIQAGIQTTGEL